MSSNSNLTFEEFGKWNEHDRLLDTRPSRIISRRRKDLQGTLLNTAVVIVNNDTLNHLDDYE